MEMIEVKEILCHTKLVVQYSLIDWGATECEPHLIKSRITFGSKLLDGYSTF